MIGLALFALLLLLAACGPARNKAAGGATSEQVVQIAERYAATGDIAQARAALEGLDVANPSQYLLLLAEQRVADAPADPATDALVQLTLALGLQSGQLMAYAAQQGLLAEAHLAPPTYAPPPAQNNRAGQAIAASNNLAASQDESASSQDAPANVADNEETVSSDNVVIDDSKSDGAAVPAVPTVAIEPVNAGDDATNSDATNSDDTNSDDSDGNGEGKSEQAAGETDVVLIPTPTQTSISKPVAQASNAMNVRAGPGTAYPIVGAMNTGEQNEIIGKNPQGDWWQVSLPNGQAGWVYGPLIQTSGDTAAIAVAANIPEPPPTPTPAPVVEAPPAEEPAAEAPPAEEAPAEEAPPPRSGNDFVLIEKRLWTVEETGGRVDEKGSVTCGEKHELYVNVVDINGNRINGVVVSSIYSSESYATGSQGKGDGVVEFVLFGGQDVKVVRDADGREVTSDVAYGMTTKSPEIPNEQLIQAGFCWDTASCDRFNFSAGCWGHHSWTVTFQRQY